jgi:hypothetical protein
MSTQMHRRSRTRRSIRALVAVTALLMGTSALVVPELASVDAAPPPPVLDWARTLGSAGGSRLWATDVAIAESGTIVAVAGTTIAAYTPAGSRLWTNRAGSDVRDVAIDSLGDVVVVGALAGPSTFGTGANQVTLTTPERESGGYEFHGYVAKYSAAGVLRWAFREGVDFNHPEAVAVAANDDIVVSGGYDSGWKVLTLGTGSNRVTLLGKGAFVATYSPAGVLRRAAPVVWSSGREPRIVDLEVAPSGDIVVGGTVASRYYDSYSNRTTGLTAMYLAVVSPTGTVRWTQSTTTDSLDVRRFAYPSGGLGGLAVDAAGNIVVVGAFAGRRTFGTGATTVELTAEYVDVFVASYTSSGSLRWAQRAGGSIDDVGSGIAVDAAGAVIVTGRFYARSPTTFGVGAAAITLPGVSTDEWREDTFVAEYAADGALRWVQRHRRRDVSGTVVISGDVSGPRVAVDAVGGFALTDRFASSITLGTDADRVTLTASAAETYAARYQRSGGAGGYVALSPVRLLDTRGDGVTVDGGFARGGLRSAGSTLELQVTGRGGVPSTALAVVLNVTATGAQSNGFVTVFPCGGTRPNASNLNVQPGVSVPNLVIAKVGSGGKVCVYTHAAMHLIADVNGFVPAGSPYVPLVPARLLDTRGDGVTVDGKFARGGIRAAGSTLELPVAGRGGVPADGRAVVLNVTAAGAQGNGFVTVFPCGTTRPNASSVNFRPGVAVPNAVVAKVGSGGKVCVYTHQATELIVDVNGHHPPASVFTSLSPARLLDTRGDGVTVDATFQRGGIRPAGSTLALQVTGRGGVPAGASAVVLNVTATGAQANGFVTVFPCGTTRPNASNVNFRPGISIPNAVIAKIGTSGQVCLYTHQATQLVVDVNGYHP